VAPVRPTALQREHRALQIRPAREVVLAGERELHVAQRRRRGRGGVEALETRTRGCIARTQRLQPPLRFTPQVVEGAAGCEPPGHGTLLPLCLSSAENQAGRRFPDRYGLACRVGVGLPCRGLEAPRNALWSLVSRWRQWLVNGGGNG